MEFTKMALENKRDSKDLDIAREIPQNVIKALHQLNLLDSLISQNVTFLVPSYIKKSDSFLDDLLAKAHLMEYGERYRVYVKTHTNSHGTSYDGIQVAPYYQLTNLAHCAVYVATFKMEG